MDILKKCNHPNIVNYYGCLIPGVILSPEVGEKDKKNKKEEKRTPIAAPLEAKAPVWVKNNFHSLF